MKPITTKPQETLDDLIFEDRNKTYGAYYMRSTYEATVKKAIAVSSSVFILVILLVSHYAFNNTSHAVAFPELDSTLVLQTYDALPPEEPKTEQVAVRVSNPIQPEIEVYKPEEKIKEILKPEVPKPEVPIIENPNPGGDTHGKITNTTTAVTNTGGGGTKPEVIPTSDEVISAPDVMPEFIGGDAALKKYITTNFKVPNYLDDDNIKIRLFFIVDENGKVTDITIARGATTILNEEAKRVVSNMPDWKPGKMGGRAVKVRYSLPINIKLQ